MILFRILKLFGIDVPARIAQVQASFEQRVEVAKDQVRQAAQTAAVVAALAAVAGLAVLSAAGVGLFALYRWVLLHYGEFYGFAAVGGVLILIAIILFEGAVLEAKSWSAEVTWAKEAGPVFEYACQEGNYGMKNNLSGARATEKKAAETAAAKKAQ